MGDTLSGEMPWKEVSPMEAKKMFIDEWLSKEWSMVELCGRHGITRKTGYKWVHRFMAEGYAGLGERSRAPHHRPSRIDENVFDELYELRRAHPKWGARKLLDAHERKWPNRFRPSHATLSRRLREQGLGHRAKTYRHPLGYCSPYSGYYGPNASWSTDFKGVVELRNKRPCHGWTLCDVTSRYVLRCDAMGSTDTRRVKRGFERAFCEYGLPEVIRSDNGCPFSSPTVGGLSQLSVWWIRLGIVPHRIQPGRPTQNGRHERMHRTLGEECPVGSSLREQQRHYERFRRMYNEERPHQSLGGRVPADVYQPSTRRYPKKDVDPVYPDNDFVIRVGTDGRLRFAGHHFFLSKVLASELVGCRQVEPDSRRLWDIYFGPVYLGRLNPKGFRPSLRHKPPPTPKVLPMS